MKLINLIKVLYKIRLFTPRSLYNLLTVLIKSGSNLMTLLYFAEKKYGERVALVDDKETLTYTQMLNQTENLSLHLKEQYDIEKGDKVLFLCKNHNSLIRGIFAVSRLGADVYLVNAEIAENQLEELLKQQQQFKLLIYDQEVESIITHSSFKGEKLLTYHIENSIEQLIHLNHDKELLERCSMGRLVLQTGWTTGRSKEAVHKPSLFNYLNPFIALIKRLKLLDYHTAYVGTPIYHGYGIAILLLFIPLGKKIVVSSDFESKQASHIIAKHQVEFMTVVPLMLQRLLKTDLDNIKNLKCIASGGTKLNEKLVNETFDQLGPVLYNLYGTSETGLNLIATPTELNDSPMTNGQPVNKQQIKIFDQHMNEVNTGEIGQIFIINDWSMINRQKRWMGTGDLAYRDERGYYYVCGRVDDMIVSGGENVYPIHVEQELNRHPHVKDVAVIGRDDHEFGHRLHAFVTVQENISEQEILNWLSTRVARYQMPKQITIMDTLPYTHLGKISKKELTRGVSK
ncbi:AMP-dependent synthetase [Filobacillus milosensis]|uniref:AMP-dependent synthetase n=1 Tax=Filobacillus milosensis TaxID=94137 RepID=A0A4Y8IR31_9BACI|nr:AMP-binding protein [Filobacillus milosensis]TFB22924.1 AMP-dependent synthetase [Filobacillus milosensis]